MTAGGERIVVLGLGYVGLPLAIALARKFDVLGLDEDSQRIEELKAGQDRTREVPNGDLASSDITFTFDPNDCRGADIYIVAAPTPVNGHNRPDLTSLIAAARTVGKLLDAERRPTVVVESTVYPGVTEDIFGTEIEAVSGLKRGPDFRLGYSPERINPGDRNHTIDKIPKVIAGEDEEVLAQLERIFGAITEGRTFRAASIKAAEAAKAIENAQRDINIAFINEVAQIFSHVGVSMWDVLAAARTKWNFLPFEPGLVGGHCIGVDPYYLSHLAEQFGHHPQVILAGRGINDGMGEWIADTLHERRSSRTGSVLVLGLTFKENLPDIRNSRSFDLVQRLVWLGHTVDVSDPLADPTQVRSEHGLDVTKPNGRKYDIVIGAVAHDEYRRMDAEALEALAARGGTIADIKGIWRSLQLDPSIDRWTL
ncbi:MAG TPA: nucleotide sugar dehydrogenase [Sphingomicrobium sp.]|nr:nucleotide sugar dehydrogenase [Sphingomicrobium sp.]